MAGGRRGRGRRREEGVKEKKEGGVKPPLQRANAPASEGGRLYLGVRGRLAEEYRRVALAERPSGREARSENSVSLFCRSAPRPNFLKLKRITGHKSLHLQAQLEIAQGRGARATAYSKGGAMDKMAACGIEVSAQELVRSEERRGGRERDSEG